MASDSSISKGHIAAINASFLEPRNPMSTPYMMSPPISYSDCRYLANRLNQAVGRKLLLCKNLAECHGVLYFYLLSHSGQNARCDCLCWIEVSEEEPDWLSHRYHCRQ